MKNTGAYAIPSKKAFPPIKGKIKRKGLSEYSKRTIEFMKSHIVEVYEDSDTGQPYVIVKERDG